MGRAASAGAEGRRGATKRAQRNGWIDLGAVHALIRLMDANRLSEVEIENAGAKIRLVREPGKARDASTPALARETAAAPMPSGEPAIARKQETNGRPIISPMVGTFYRSPGPDAPPFVEEGSVVEKGDTLCIIEAMKMMNEIEAEFRGRVTRVIASNGQTVEYGEELLFVEPL